MVSVRRMRRMQLMGSLSYSCWELVFLLSPRLRAYEYSMSHKRVCDDATSDSLDQPAVLDVCWYRQPTTRAVVIVAIC